MTLLIPDAPEDEEFPEFLCMILTSPLNAKMSSMLGLLTLLGLRSHGIKLLETELTPKTPFMFPLRFNRLVLPTFDEEVGLDRRERLHERLLLFVVCCCGS